MGAIFAMSHVLQRQCTTTVTETTLRPTIAGDHRRHLEFMEDSLGRAGVTSTDDVNTIVEVDICIKETRATFTKNPKGVFAQAEPYTTHCDSDGGTPTCVADEKTDYTVDGYLEYYPCVAEWVQCHPDFPWNKNAPITRRNLPCLSGADTSITGITDDEGDIAQWPAVGWCGDDDAKTRKRRLEQNNCFIGTKVVGDVSFEDDGCEDRAKADYYASEDNLDKQPPAGASWYASMCGRRLNPKNVYEYGAMRGKSLRYEHHTREL